MKKTSYYITVTVAIALFFYVLGCAITSNQFSYRYKATKHLNIIGTYSIDNSDEKPLTDYKVLDDSKAHNVVIKGHFSRKIPPYEEILFHLCNLKITFKINDETVLTFGEDNDSIFESPGITWRNYISKGITTEDEIEIILENVYENMATPVFSIFFNDLQSGYSYFLYQQLISEHGSTLLFAFAFSMIGIGLFVYSFVSFLYKRKYMDRSMAISFMIFVVGSYIIMDACFDLMPLIIRNPEYLNLLDILVAYVLPISVIMVFSSYTRELVQKIYRICTMVFSLFLIFTFTIQITGMYDMASFLPIFIFINIIVSMIIFICSCYEVVVVKNREYTELFIGLYPLLIGSFLEITSYWPYLGLVSYVIKGSIILTCVVLFRQFIKSVQNTVNEEKRLQHMETELVQAKISIMFSQIQPHFLYNTLNTICYLCETSPKVASSITEKFAKYLRGNLDSITRKNTITFVQELEHLKCYLAIEEIRFPDIKVVYDINTTEFFLPALTVQPLVENAIKHGLMDSEEGGEVLIKTYEDEYNWYVKITDNGIGFDTAKEKEDDRSHIGIKNTKERLKSMCSGELIIESKIGEGTVAKVIIPKKVGDI